VADAIRDGILVKEQRPDGYRICRLNRNHGGVKDVLAGRPVKNITEFGGPPREVGAGAGSGGGYATTSPAPRINGHALAAAALDPQAEWRRRARELGLPDVEEEEEAMYRTSAPVDAPLDDE
jgi:hypothetical protein